MRCRNVMTLLCALHLVTVVQSIGQTAVVSGSVTTATGVVKSASVTFLETENPGHSYAALTDSTGRYQVSLALTSVAPGTTLPSAFALSQNYPNPFSSSTTIAYDLSAQADARVTVFDVLGRVVREAGAGIQPAGSHSVLWDATDAGGRRVTPGVYFYRLQVGGEFRARKMIVDRGAPATPSFGARVVRPAASAVPAFSRAVAGMNFTVRVENTPATAPPIYTAQFENVQITRDTTLDLPVTAQPPAPVATVYPDSTLQLIRGFGGANIIPWRPAMTAGQMATAFGSGPGQLGFTILRLRIPYTTDINEFNAQAAAAQLAQSAGALIVFASPWTPPPAMKSNNNIVGGSLNEGSYAEYAAHLKAFADHLAAQSVPLYAVSLQNEPDASVTYESCDWTAVQFRTFLKNNAASIGYRIMMPESQNFVRALSDSSLNDPVAAAQISIIAGHIYGGGLSPYPLAVSKGKEIWMTEHLVLDTTWSAVLGTGREIHDCMMAGWNAYIWWYIVRYYGPIGEDGNVTKRGYVMSQFSRFVRPGYHRIACTQTPQRNVWVSAYRDGASGRVVIVALNTGSARLPQSFSIAGGTMSAFSSYTTSQTKSCEKGTDIPASHGMLTTSLEPSSIMTFVSK